jgi:Uma2 family endonuclease
VELIDGEIIEMAAIGIPHADAVATLTDLAAELVGRDVRISVQNPVHLGPRTEPQPDIALVRRRRYRASHPTLADIFLLVEVADSTLAYDRNIKLPMYAAAGIAETWLVDLNHGTIERHTEPRDGRYSRIAIAGRGEVLASTILPAFVVLVDAIFGEDDEG